MQIVKSPLGKRLGSGRNLGGGTDSSAMQIEREASLAAVKAACRSIGQLRRHGRFRMFVALLWPDSIDVHLRQSCLHIANDQARAAMSCVFNRVESRISRVYFYSCSYFFSVRDPAPFIAAFL